MSINRLRVRFRQNAAIGWTLLMALVSVALFWFLSRHHAFVSMWVEGLGEIIETEVPLLGFSKAEILCSCKIGSLALPLGQDPHFGPVWFYQYLPALYLWFHKLVADPYIYRYTGILILIADGWILYYLARKYYKPSISFYSATVFFTCPLFLLGTLTDYEFDNTMVFLTLGTVLVFSHYLKSGRTRWLLASAFALGTILLTRTQSFIWLIVPFAIYLLVANPPLILDRWKQTKRKRAVALGALCLLALGASPMIAYYLVCPQFNVFSYTLNTVVQGSFDSSNMSMPARLTQRITQLWEYGLLHTWKLYDMEAPNYVMALVWVACACALALRWIRKRQPSPLLVMIPVVIVLSVLTKGMVREEHLLVLEPAVLLVIPAGLALVAEHKRFGKLVHLVFALLIAANITVAAMDWRHWRELRAGSDLDALINHSDPVLLADHLSERYTGQDRILYTNIGIAQYMRYMTAGRLFSEDIMDWYDEKGFLNSAKLALMDHSKRRIFVAVSRERDGRRFQLRRTEPLYALLDEHKIPYKVTQVLSASHAPRYDVIEIDRGIGPADTYAASGAFAVTDVRDVRAVAGAGGASEVIGSVIGEGFKRTDAVRINGDLVTPTVYGNDQWITFSIALDSLGDGSSFTLEVIRPETLQRSNAFVAKFQR